MTRIGDWVLRASLASLQGIFEVIQRLFRLAHEAPPRGFVHEGVTSSPQQSI